MNQRPKRKLPVKTDTPSKIPRKWDKKEMENLLMCIMQNGHKSFEHLQRCIPQRTLDNIKMFIRTVYDTAVKNSKGHAKLDSWISLCNRECLGKNMSKDSIQVAQVLKFLSVDGLLENHPLPQRSNGINFSEAYRFVYQALMGYPIQPISEPTANFVQQTFAELLNESKIEVTARKEFKSFLVERYNYKKKLDQNEPSGEVNNQRPKVTPVTDKPLKVYQRKKKNNNSSEPEAPSLKIVIAASNEESNSNCAQNYIVTIEGKESENEKVPTTFNVPVPVKVGSSTDEEEKELLKSISYNPFRIPENWLQEPVYLNLLKKE